MKIAAIVVTYNRRHQLGELLGDLLSQSRRPDGILVTDNGSEDGTGTYVREHFPSVQLKELGQNTGHMGGFEVAVTSAFDQDFDAIVSIDDDARLRTDTLECLFCSIESREELRDSVVWCANVSPDGQYFTEPVVLKIDDEWKIYQRFLPELQGKVFESLGGANIGIYIPRSVFEKAGPPWGILAFNGEEEYKYRIKKNGFKLYYCLSSIIYHKRYDFFEVNLWGRTRFISKVPPWHTYYEIRNRIYIDRIHKRRTLVKNLLVTALDAFVKMRVVDNKMTTLFFICKAVVDGFLGRMGMTVTIPRMVQKLETNG